MNKNNNQRRFSYFVILDVVSVPGYCHQQHEEAQRLDWAEEKWNREKKKKNPHSRWPHAVRFVVTLWENHSSYAKPAVCKTVDPHDRMKDGDDIRRASIRYEISFFFSLIPVPNRCHLICSSGDRNMSGRSEPHKHPKHTFKIFSVALQKARSTVTVRPLTAPHYQSISGLRIGTSLL